MNLTNLKISVRLSVAFGLVSLFLLMIIGIGITNLSTLNDGTDKLVNHDFEKVQICSDALDNLRGSIASVFQLVATDNEEETSTAKQRFKKNQDAFNDDINKLDQLLKRTDTREILAKIMASRDRYSKAVEKAQSLLASGNRADASKQAYGEAYKELHAFAADFRTMLDLQKKIFKESDDASVETYHTARLHMIMLGVLALIIGVVGAYTITRSISIPLQQAISVAESIADGDLTQHINHDRQDELGQLLAALYKMKSNLSHIVGQVRGGAETIATASAEIAQGNADLSSRTEAEAGALEETASSMEELTSTVKQNADNARQANKLAQQASGVAISGGSAVARVVETMGAINQSAKKIVDIISVIDGIAFQTNILALNAAVEAARAGEQGRGFAVVASEVRNLAQRSASAAKEIKELIGASVENVDAGSKLVHEAGVTMNEVVSSIKSVTDIMAEITAASVEQSQGIDQINMAINEMDNVTQQNAALVEEASAAAMSMQDQTRHLLDVVSVFNVAR